jgi:hypothetical protein
MIRTWLDWLKMSDAQRIIYRDAKARMAFLRQMRRVRKRRH